MPTEIRTTQELINIVKKRDPHESEFFQAVQEVLKTLEPILNKDQDALQVAHRLVEPERMIIFRVPWTDDNGVQHVNRGFRIQFNSALGPYKGGLRFHPTVTLSVIKFLGFEQIFKNALTGLPMGGGKGGSDFNPKGRSDAEVMRFCQAFMTELVKHIGEDTDVPAGDIGVGAREIGYLFGQYKRLQNRFVGILTGKGPSFGGSHIRPEATGFGLIYFLVEMLKEQNQELKGKRVLLSGSGNVSQHAAEKALELGAKVLTMSDSSGYIYCEDGISKEDLAQVMKIKNEQRGRIKELCEFNNKIKYYDGEKPWKVRADIALPCATQNEIDLDDAKALVNNGIKIVAEGANMPSTAEAQDHFLENDIYYGPAKACNSGGVAVSGLEMSQNSVRLQWTSQEVDEKLHTIMQNVFRNTKEAAKKIGNEKNLMAGANIAGFLKVKEAMIAQGIV